MEIEKYLNQKIELQKLLLLYIESPDNFDKDFQNLIKQIKEYEIGSNPEELEHLLQLILSISNNHHRPPRFFDKIERILLFFEKEIKQTFSNFNLFNIFYSNKRILLFLFHKKMIDINETIASRMVNLDDQNGTEYCHFFLPEIKKFIQKEKIERIEKEISEFSPSYYEEKRQIGENDLYISELIRNDSIEDFISYMNQKDFLINGTIKHSIFETNSFLIDHDPTLIEYAAFFGSVRIFQYLQSNEAELKPSLWFYAIHSNSAEMIQTHVEANNIKPFDKSYINCFIESIKCHHLDISNYIMNNNIGANKVNHYFDYRNIINCEIFNHNYSFFPKEFDEQFTFFCLCNYKFINLVNLYLKTIENTIEDNII